MGLSAAVSGSQKVTELYMALLAGARAFHTEACMFAGSCPDVGLICVDFFFDCEQYLEFANKKLPHERVFLTELLRLMQADEVFYQTVKELVAEARTEHEGGLWFGFSLARRTDYAVTYLDALREARAES